MPKQPIAQLEYRQYDELFAVALSNVAVLLPDGTMKSLPPGEHRIGHSRITVRERELSETYGTAVGRRYRGAFRQGTWLCECWEKRTGFFMRSEQTDERTDISERAIDRTWHEVRDADQ